MGETLVVIITGVYLKAQYRRDALQSFKADGFVTKPCRPVELQRVVLGLLAKKLKNRHGRRLRVSMVSGLRHGATRDRRPQRQQAPEAS